MALKAVSAKVFRDQSQHAFFATMRLMQIVCKLEMVETDVTLKKEDTRLRVYGLRLRFRV